MLKQENVVAVVEEVGKNEELSDNPQKYEELKRKLSRIANDSQSMADYVNSMVWSSYMLCREMLK